MTEGYCKAKRQNRAVSYLARVICNAEGLDLFSVGWTSFDWTEVVIVRSFIFNLFFQIRMLDFVFYVNCICYYLRVKNVFVKLLIVFEFKLNLPFT